MLLLVLLRPSVLLFCCALWGALRRHDTPDATARPADGWGCCALLAAVPCPGLLFRSPVGRAPLPIGSGATSLCCAYLAEMTERSPNPSAHAKRVASRWRSRTSLSAVRVYGSQASATGPRARASGGE